MSLTTYFQTHFFSYLTLYRAISPLSFLELLQSFLVVLDEPGVSYERLHAAATCAGEGLMRVYALPFWAVI